MGNGETRFDWRMMIMMMMMAIRHPTSVPKEKGAAEMPQLFSVVDLCSFWSCPRAILLHKQMALRTQPQGFGRNISGGAGLLPAISNICIYIR